MEDEKWKLPKALRISDPKVLAQAEQMEAELSQRAQSPFAQLSSADQHRARAIRIAEELKRDLGEVRRMLKEDATDGLKAAEVSLAAQLAEQYAITGRYDLAADCHPDPAQREVYVGILEAINRDDDDEPCKCAPGRDFVVQDIWSLKHNATVSLVKCSGCGELNAKPLPAHLAKQRAHRSKAAAMVADLAPDDASERLKQAGHTTDKLK